MPTTKSRASITFEDPALYELIEQYAQRKKISFSRAAQQMLGLAAEHLEDKHFSRVGDERLQQATHWMTHSKADLQANSLRLLDYLGTAGRLKNHQAPESRIRSVRDEWE